MTKQRKAELRKKGAIVAWNCQDDMGMCHLFYLKVQNGRFTLVRKTPGQPDVQANPAGEGYYRLDKKEKISGFIMAMGNQLKRQAVAVSKPIYLVNIEKVKVIPRLARKALKEAKRQRGWENAKFKNLTQKTP